MTNKWPDERKDLLRTLTDQRMTAADIADRMGLTISQVQNAQQRDGLGDPR